LDLRFEIVDDLVHEIPPGFGDVILRHIGDMRAHLSAPRRLKRPGCSISQATAEGGNAANSLRIRIISS
jgi:hypothetical protein